MIRAPVTSLQGVACLLPRAAHTARSGFPIWRGNGAPKCQTEMPCSPASLDFHSFFSQSHSFSQCLLTTHHVPGLAPGLDGELAIGAVGIHPEQPRTNRTAQRAGGPDGSEWRAGGQRRAPQLARAGWGPVPTDVRGGGGVCAGEAGRPGGGLESKHAVEAGVCCGGQGWAEVAPRSPRELGLHAEGCRCLGRRLSRRMT